LLSEHELGAPKGEGYYQPSALVELAARTPTAMSERVAVEEDVK